MGIIYIRTDYCSNRWQPNRQKKALTVALQMARDSCGRARIIHVIEGSAYNSGAVQTESCASDINISICTAASKMPEDAQGSAQPFGVDTDTQLFHTF